MDYQVLIIETNSTGHHLSYVRLLAEEALRRGYGVHLLVGSDTPKSEEFAFHLGHLLPNLVMSTCQTVRLRRIVRIARAAGIHHIVIPDGDHLAMRLGLGFQGLAGHGRPSVSLLVMRDPDRGSSSSASSAWRRMIKRSLLASAGTRRGVAVFRLASAFGDPPTSNKFYVRDPVTLSADTSTVRRIRSKWGMSEHLIWFGIIGAITARKNVPLVIAALTELKRPVGLLMAGRASGSSIPSEEDIEKLTCSGVHLVTVNRMLTDVELDSAVAAVDCVLLLHDNEGPSGIFGKALASGTAVLAGGATSLREDVERAGMGKWVALTMPAVSGAMKQFLDNPARVEAQTPPSEGISPLLNPQRQRAADRTCDAQPHDLVR